MAQTFRFKTREVQVGSVGIGGDNPIRIQSMTTTDTKDVYATVEQIKKLVDHGCELVRVTVQGIKEAESCESIKNRLLKDGILIPLIADIHFFPQAALFVADFVEKVRINPGNFVDKRAVFKKITYDDSTYAKELLRIEEKFLPLVEKCKRLKKPIRIGTNHGSLSDRIMNRFGDTPEGMIESAFEYARICRNHDFHDLIFSMKSSNPKVMIQAYRLLVKRMEELGWDYPLHLGVTEAGYGLEGRLKSAIGTGTLLLEGIGDTIRVSLTEDPWNEIEPCKQLIKLTNREPLKEKGVDTIEKRSIQWPNFPLHKDGSIIGKDLYLETPPIKQLIKGEHSLPIVSIDQLPHQISPFALQLEDESPTLWTHLLHFKPDLILLSPSKNRLFRARRFFSFLKEHKLPIPVLLAFSYSCPKEELPLVAGSEMGALLIDGLGEGIFIDGPYDLQYIEELSLALLQAARMRMTKADFISCPSCGRTLFELQEVSARIRSKTAHLAGVKIAIMGCIVNGPGEMADSDFGYVGSKPGMIDLYLGKTCVEKNIPFEHADEKLIGLIKREGSWIEPALAD